MKVPEQPDFNLVAKPRSSSLAVHPLEPAEKNLFRYLYETAVRPYYSHDTKDYADWILSTHFSQEHRAGYFTKQKTIWVMYSGGRPCGISVATEKRGGSIKFGPTALLPASRGHGFGTQFRLLLERQYPNARKYYNTLPSINSAALSYVLRAGYSVEAHLPGQYENHGELVVGKIARPGHTLYPKHPTYPPSITTRLVDAGRLSLEKLSELVPPLLSDWYDEIDAGFVTGLAHGFHSDLSFSQKSKRGAILLRGNRAAGLIVVTPKRGGSLKCSPLVIRNVTSESLGKLLEFASSCFFPLNFRRHYLHIPLMSTELLRHVLAAGFKPEGILREPYKSGVDLVALGRTQHE